MGPSGSSEDDNRLAAKKLFESRKENGRFKFSDCWLVLRHEPKWQAWVDNEPKTTKTISNKRSQASDNNTTDEHASNGEENLSSSSTPSRPIGMKNAKSEKIQEILLTRQVHATESIAENARERIKVAQEHNDIQIFSMRLDPDDRQIASN
ncbi:hypothetical protein AC1031_003542 [Aphanomyces cochlioides]|nr:hypothetical protein AC1031_003542 [Aphanomyces cochlioides]